MPHRNKTEEIRAEDGTPILSLAGHIAHEAGGARLRIEVFREDTEGWVLADVYLTSEGDFRISPPFRSAPHIFRLVEFGRYAYVNDHGKIIPLERRSSGRIKLFVIEFEDYSKKFFGG